MDTEERVFLFVCFVSGFFFFFLQILAFVSTSLKSTSSYDVSIGHASRVMSFNARVKSGPPGLISLNQE